MKNCEVGPILSIIFQLVCPANRRHNIMICDCEYIVYSRLTVAQLEKAFLMHTHRPRICTAVHIPTTTAVQQRRYTFVKNKRMLQQQSLSIRIHTNTGDEIWDWDWTCWMARANPVAYIIHTTYVYILYIQPIYIYIYYTVYAHTICYWTRSCPLTGQCAADGRVCTYYT